jgi:diguanylate cyclase (GGDEF)-like protein/PAS domain S-box-containing protein
MAGCRLPRVRLLRSYRDAVLIAVAALLSAALAASLPLGTLPLVLVAAVGGALLPALLLWVERRGRRRREHAFLQRLIDNLPDALYLKDAESRYVMVNRTFARERGCAPEDIVGKTSREVLGAEAQAAIDDDRTALRGIPVSKEQALRHPLTGDEHFRLVTKRRVENELGVPLVIGYHLDLTQWKLAERELQAALRRQESASERTRQFAQRLLDAVPMPVYIKDAQSRYIIVNETLTKEWQRPAAEMIGVTSMSLAPTEEIARVMREEDVAVLAGGSVYKEEENYHPVTGKGRFRVVTKTLCHDAEGAPVIVCTMFDTTAWRNAEHDLKAVLERETALRGELERVAYEDSLTGLANRRYFLAEAERAAARADRHDQALSLLMFDLDHFKRINDTHSHQAGDDVLARVAERTRNSLRAEDMAARWGGEEFVVLLPLTALPEAMLVANRLRAAIAATPTPTCAGPLPVSCSCGVAQRRRGERIADFIARADAALYAAKDAGRNACVAAPLT